MAFLSRLFRRDTAQPVHRRSFDAATGGRRGSSFRAFGSTGPETLAAAAPLPVTVVCDDGEVHDWAGSVGATGCWIVVSR